MKQASLANEVGFVGHRSLLHFFFGGVNIQKRQSSINASSLEVRGIIMLFKLGSRNRLINIDKSAC